MFVKIYRNINNCIFDNNKRSAVLVFVKNIYKVLFCWFTFIFGLEIVWIYPVKLRGFESSLSEKGEV